MNGVIQAAKRIHKIVGRVRTFDMHWKVVELSCKRMVHTVGVGRTAVELFVSPVAGVQRMVHIVGVDRKAVAERPVDAARLQSRRA